MKRNKRKRQGDGESPSGKRAETCPSLQLTAALLALVERLSFATPGHRGGRTLHYREASQ